MQQEAGEEAAQALAQACLINAAFHVLRRLV